MIDIRCNNIRENDFFLLENDEKNKIIYLTYYIALKGDIPIAANNADNMVCLPEKYIYIIYTHPSLHTLHFQLILMSPYSRHHNLPTERILHVKPGKAGVASALSLSFVFSFLTFKNKPRSSSQEVK